MREIEYKAIIKTFAALKNQKMQTANQVFSHSFLTNGIDEV